MQVLRPIESQLTQCSAIINPPCAFDAYSNLRTDELGNARKHCRTDDSELSTGGKKVAGIHTNSHQSLWRTVGGKVFKENISCSAV
jgi:hypothetical protein